MQIRFNQLAGQLDAGLAPVYLLCGDEPYQLGEAARLIRERARREGFAEREVLDAEAGFDWARLGMAADAMSLFSERKLIELRVGSGKLGREGSEAVRAYCERLCADNLLLILAPGLERKDLQAQWAKRVESLGALIQVWPLREKELETWIDRRLRDAGFQPAAGVCGLLAERAEGNMLAAVQELEKLRLLQDPGPLTLEDLLGTLADSARFDLFALTDAALEGNRARVQRILSILRGEGTADVLVLWVLARELRMLAEAALALSRRQPLAPVLAAHRVPRMRHAAIERALSRLTLARLHHLLHLCGQADLSIKGVGSGDPWHRLALIADALCVGGLMLPVGPP